MKRILIIMCSSISTITNGADVEPVRPLSFLEAAACGTLAGTAELITGNPLQNTKIRYQQKLPFTADPRILYKNGVLTAVCMGPTTMVQGVCNEQLTTIAGGPCWQATAASGAISGMLATPTDAIAQYRLTMNTPMVDSAKRAPIAMGAMATIPREAIWATGLFYVRPQWTRVIHQYTENETLAKVVGGMAAGSVVAVISHPCDTVATVLRQSIIQRSMLSEMIAQQKEILPFMRHELDTIRHLNAKGLRSYYPGVVPRGVRASIAASVIGNVYDAIADHMRG